jgi:hypothetical protein
MGLCTATFEAGVNGVRIATTDPGSQTPWDAVLLTSTGDTKYDTTHPAHGSLGAHIINGGQAQLEWSTAFGTQTDHFGRIYMYVPSGANFIDVVRLNNAGTFACGIDIDNLTGVLNLRDTTAAIISSTTNTVARDQLVRIETHIVHAISGGTIEVQLFNTADSPVPTETKLSLGMNNQAQATKIDYGAVVGRGQDWWLDDIVAGATSYPGPVAPPTDVILPTWSRLRFNG